MTLRPIESFYAVNPETGCWDWVRSTSPSGYGAISWIRAAGGTQRAHRHVYELHHGPVPVGLVLDHLCRNKKCVNPEHLEPVTPRENAMRGISPSIVAHRTDVCMKGLHRLTPDNVIIWRNGRRCKACCREGQKLKTYRRREKRNSLITSTRP